MNMQRFLELTGQLATSVALQQRQAGQLENIHGHISELGIAALKKSMTHNKQVQLRLKAEMRHLLSK